MATKKSTTKKKAATRVRKSPAKKAAPRKRATTKAASKSKPAKVSTRSRARTGRSASVVRKTSETSIQVDLSVDGPTSYAVDTGVPFLDHMLEALARHAGLGLKVKASGDVHIDDHHTVEDVGLAIGAALKDALGDKAGIYRFGHFEAPLDEALVAVTIDLSGRPYLVYNVKIRRQRVGVFDIDLIEDFMQAFMTAAGMNLHVNLRYGRNPHHILEATFKALAKALAMACAHDERGSGVVPSTKGTLAG